jgi:hypothetical protein
MELSRPKSTLGIADPLMIIVSLAVPQIFDVIIYAFEIKAYNKNTTYYYY